MWGNYEGDPPFKAVLMVVGFSQDIAVIGGTNKTILVSLIMGLFFLSASTVIVWCQQNGYQTKKFSEAMTSWEICWTHRKNLGWAVISY